MNFHPDVLAAHAQFGGDLELMQKCYDWPNLKAAISALERERGHMVPISNDGNSVFIDGPGDVELDHGGKLRARAEAAERERDELKAALEDAADQLERAHNDAFRQSSGYGLVTSDGREFSCFELNKCGEAASRARRRLSLVRVG